MVCLLADISWQLCTDGVMSFRRCIDETEQIDICVITSRAAITVYGSMSMLSPERQRMVV